jgi:predicted component of type VI protein secretion system
MPDQSDPQSTWPILSVEVPAEEDTSPFVIGVIGDFRGDSFPRKKLKERQFTTMGAASFDRIIRTAGPWIPANPALGVDEEIHIQEFSDFSRTGLSRLLKKDAALLWEDPGFRRLRSTWSGLKFLLESTAMFRNVRVKILDLTKREARRDLMSASRVDQTLLYRKIEENEFGTLGGEPFGCILFDYWLTNSEEDAIIARELSDLATLATVSFLVGISPCAFGVTGYDELDSPVRAASIIKKTWNSEWPESNAGKDCGYCFGLLPRIAFPGPHGGTEPGWMHPGFMTSAIAAEALQQRDPAGSARILFRERAADGGEHSAHPLGEPVVSFEWNCPESLVGTLREAGFNAFAPAMRWDTLLRDMVPLDERGIGPTSSLAQALLAGQVRVALNSYMRRKKASYLQGSPSDTIKDWVDGLNRSNRGPGCAGLPFEYVSMQLGQHNVRIHFSLLPGVAGSERRIFTVSVPMP